MINQFSTSVFVVLTLLGSTLGWAQDAPAKIVGQVWFVDATTAKPWERVFLDGLRERGYVEGKNLKIVSRYANGDTARLRGLLDELIALPVEVLVISPKAVRDAAAATKSIPLVCYSLGDAMKDGLVASLRRPGGNLTGMYMLDAEVAGKRLELATELVPDLKRVGVIFDATDMSSATEADVLRSLAQTIDVSVRSIAVRNLGEIQNAVNIFERDRVQALIVADTAFFYLHREALLRMAGNRFPVVAHSKDWAKDGALFTYAPNFYAMLKRTAVHVDKILQGTKAGDIPIEQATTFELVVNMKTAKAFGLMVPESILLRANEIIR